MASNVKIFCLIVPPSVTCSRVESPRECPAGPAVPSFQWSGSPFPPLHQEMSNFPGDVPAKLCSAVTPKNLWPDGHQWTFSLAPFHVPGSLTSVVPLLSLPEVTSRAEFLFGRVTAAFQVKGSDEGARWTEVENGRA